jgi:hypothetical protein
VADVQDQKPSDPLLAAVDEMRAAIGRLVSQVSREHEAARLEDIVAALDRLPSGDPESDRMIAVIGLQVLGAGASHRSAITQRRLSARLERVIGRLAPDDPLRSFAQAMYWASASLRAGLEHRRDLADSALAELVSFAASVPAGNQWRPWLFASVGYALIDLHGLSGEIRHLDQADQYVRLAFAAAEPGGPFAEGAPGRASLLFLRGHLTVLRNVYDRGQGRLPEALADLERAVQFDDVILVGGMTRVPAVTRILKERLDLDARHYEPDLAVAEGAAQYALVRAVRAEAGQAAAPDRVAAMTGLTVSQAERLAATRVATVVPRAFGVKSIDGRDPLALTDPIRARQIIVHLLPANTELPTDTGPYTFLTSIDNQRHIGIEVWEQAGQEASEDLAENRKIGEGILRNLPPRLPAQTPIEVTFYMSETGLLTVEAAELRSGSDLRFELQIGGLDQEGMKKARQSVSRYRVSG